MSEEFSRKELLSLLSSVLDNLDYGKIKKNERRVVQDPVSFLNRQDTFACLSKGHRKPLFSVSTRFRHIVARTGKLRILPSNPFLVVVSPLKVLISDQLESCQTLKLKAVKMKLEQFDNDDKLKEPRMLFSSRTMSIA